MMTSSMSNAEYGPWVPIAKDWAKLTILRTNCSTTGTKMKNLSNWKEITKDNNMETTANWHKKKKKKKDTILR
jgi:hypothetical protein